MILKGGKGGFGNFKFKSSRNVAPKKSNPGQPGNAMWVRLRLNLIADVGIIGLPNVGKSSFLKSITNANPKIGDYPFTTLRPNLGVVSYENYEELVIADIPGIIKNASSGTGLGLKFLGHVEKCKVLLHFLDCSQKNIIKNYEIIRKELSKYGSGLKEKKEILVLTKSDLINEGQVNKYLKQLKSYSNKNVIPISINKSFPDVPFFLLPEPSFPLSALKCCLYLKSTRVFLLLTARNAISPPLPPSPPSGPPYSIYFSLLKLTQPFPPEPDCKKILASSRNFIKINYLQKQTSFQMTLSRT